MTVELITPPEDIRSVQNTTSFPGSSLLLGKSPGNEVVQNTPTHQSRLFATMKIKGGKETKFQIDTGATCNVLKKSAN